MIKYKQLLLAILGIVLGVLLTVFSVNYPDVQKYFRSNVLLIHSIAIFSFIVWILLCVMFFNSKSSNRSTSLIYKILIYGVAMVVAIAILLSALAVI